MKKHNFNAGPSILADEVIENAAKAILDFNGSGLSLLSISHRTKDFDDVMAEADVLFREIARHSRQLQDHLSRGRCKYLSSMKFPPTSWAGRPVM